jgi:hypothetical protein
VTFNEEIAGETAQLLIVDVHVVMATTKEQEWTCGASLGRPAGGENGPEETDHIERREKKLLAS